MNVITKSDFIRYRQCPTNAWIYKHKPDVFSQKEYSEFEKGLMKTGNEVDMYAREYFEGGVLCGDEIDTEKHISRKTPVLYQPRFSTDMFLCVCDILVYNERTDRYDIYEVKASTYGGVGKHRNKREEYRYDVLFQREVLARCGVSVGKTFLLLVDNAYVLGDFFNPKRFFKPMEIGYESENEKEGIAGEMVEAYRYIYRDSVLSGCLCVEKSRANHCHTFWYSNPDIPEYSIHDIARIQTKKIQMFLADTVVDISAIDDVSSLTDIQRMQVEVEKNGQEMVNTPALAEFFSSIVYPLAFLDYETCPLAVPRFKGYKPYNQIPFQFSLHILHRDGALEHREFIHLSQDAPDVVFTEALFDALPEKGTIFVWNESFELGRNRDIVARNPRYAKRYDALEERCVDLIVPFSKMWWVDPKFRGKTSIKYVLPALCPASSYDDLDIRDGGMAASAWEEIVWQGGCLDSEREERVKNLLLYCKRDTEAMVDIFKVIQARIV